MEPRAQMEEQTLEESRGSLYQKGKRKYDVKLNFRCAGEN